MEGPDLQFTEAVIDNGDLGRHVVRFESGLLARQAAGSATVFLDEDTMVLSATTAQSKPRDAIDFFPLTVDVEERMYAVGRIPGSFFRREGRPSEGAILTCRLIDRPLRPCFVKGLRNEVQVVVTVLALNPDKIYDVVAINAASLSTQLAGLPFSGPVGGVRVALIGDRWVGFPDVAQLEQATFDMVVAGRVLPDGDVAIMMVEAESTEHTWNLVGDGKTAPTEEVVAAGLEAAKPFIAALCDAQAELAARFPKTTAEFPIFLEYAEDVYAAVAAAATDELAQVMTIADKQTPRGEHRGLEGRPADAARSGLRGPGEGDRRCVPRTDQEACSAAHPARAGTDRRPWCPRHPYAVRRGRRRAARARLGALPARRDPDPRRLHAEHAGHGAEARHAWRRRRPSATCTTTTSRPTPPAKPAGSVRPSGARSATEPWPSEPWCRCCRRARSSRTRSGRSPKRSAPTAPRPWARSAPRPSRC